MRNNIKKISENTFQIDKSKIYVSENLLENVEDAALEQIKNVSELPGIVNEPLAMPDIHTGYGFPIGGVAAFDAKNGIITPGGIGFDINCGVRVLTTNLQKNQILSKVDELLKLFLKNIDTGIGCKGSKIKLTKQELDEILETGVNWAVKNNYATKDELELCEEKGCMTGADASKVSQKAKGRGINALGTLGSGNHFIEIQFVEKILDKEIAKTFGIENENQVLIMIHSGSRGLGHQVAKDYLKKIEKEYKEIIDKLPEKNLAYAPINSEIGQDYIKAMKAAANYAWTNRQIMTHYVRQSFKVLFGSKTKVNLLYDVSHNIAKYENHIVNGKEKRVCVHRKGATRAFPPGHKEIPKKYKETGQPIILPGSCGTNSYILAGTQKAMEISFGSCSHGAGRKLSRTQAMKQFSGENIAKELKKKNISIKGTDFKGIASEAPLAYKDVDEVINVISTLGIGKPVAKLTPLGVIKG